MKLSARFQFTAALLIFIFSGCSRVYLPNGYYLKVSNQDANAPFLYDSHNHKVLEDQVGEFIVKDPYVIFSPGVDSFLLLNTNDGDLHRLSYDLLITEAGKFKLLPILSEQYLTFWDIAGGYKPYTWPHKKPFWVIHEYTR